MESTITKNIFRIQTYDSVMCGNFILKGKNLVEFTNLFSPNAFKKNDGIILNSFKNASI